jgi:hypothetical protein
MATLNIKNFAGSPGPKDPGAREARTSVIAEEAIHSFSVATASATPLSIAEFQGLEKKPGAILTRANM